MSTVTSVSRQATSAQKSTNTKPHKVPMQLAGRLLGQFEEDLQAGDQVRAGLVNKALLELQELLPEEQARLIKRGIENAWRRACGWSF